MCLPDNFTIRSKERSQTGLVCILAITAPRKPRNRIYPIGNIKHAVQSMGAVQRYLRRGWKCSKKVMIRSLYRDSDKLIQTEDEQYISRLRSQIDKARTERDRESKKYLRLWKTVRKEFGDEKAWELIEKAEE